VTRPLLLALTLLTGQAIAGRVATNAPAAPLTADQLAAKVIAARPEKGFRLRATLTRTTAGNQRDVRHLFIKGRRDTGSIVLYQQIWPEVPGGRALVIEDVGDHRLSGFQYEAGRVTPLSDAALGGRFLDSDLTLEDLAENYWYWPTRSRGREEDIGQYQTVAVDFRPGRAASTYSRVRAWIAPEIAFGLRTEVYGPTGALARTIGSYRILKFGERWVAGIVTVDPADRRSRTVVEGVGGERNVAISRSEFTPAAIRKALSSSDHERIKAR
jgi:hypothetical protein